MITILNIYQSYVLIAFNWKYMRKNDNKFNKASTLNRQEKKILMDALIPKKENEKYTYTLHLYKMSSYDMSRWIGVMRSSG